MKQETIKGAKLIKPDGTTETVTPHNGTDFTLEELQAFVNGYIEIINYLDGYMVLNEDGKRVLQRNNTATTMAREATAIFPWDYIAGNALVCERNMVQ